MGCSLVGIKKMRDRLIEAPSTALPDNAASVWSDEAAGEDAGEYASEQIDLPSEEDALAPYVTTQPRAASPQRLMRC